MSELSDEEYAKLIQQVNGGIKTFLEDSTEYIIPVEKEKYIIKMDKKYPCLNLTVEAPLSGEFVSKILTQFKIQHDAEEVKKTKFLVVFISNKANVSSFIPARNVYSVQHDNTKTIILM